MGLFAKRRSGVGTAILAGVGGLFVGAGIMAALTPFTGPQLRKLVVELLDMKGSKKLEEPVDQQLERMAGEGGVAHEVKPPAATKAFETSHS